MSTSYPGAVDSYSTHTDGQKIYASHVNDLQDSVVAAQQNVSPYMSDGAQNIYQGSSLSDSDFVATIATLPGGATLTYNAPGSGDEANLVPASTSQWAKMVLHNTTQGDNALISNCVTGTNTIALTDNVPGTWQVGDTITIRSQTNTGTIAAGCYFVDFEFTAGIDLDATIFAAHFGMTDTGGVAAHLQLHPHLANVNNLRRAIYNHVAGIPMYLSTTDIPLYDVRFCLAWHASGANTLTISAKLISYRLTPIPT